METTNNTSVAGYLSRRKEIRMEMDVADHIGAQQFNLIMCGVLAWGFLVNALMVTYLTEPLFDMLQGVRPIVLIIGYLVLGIGGVVLSAKSDNPWLSFLGFNMLVLPMGVLLCLLLPTIPVVIVNKALILTGIVTATMVVLGVTFPQLFLGIGRTLFVALLAGLVAEVVATLLLGYRGAAFDWFFVLIFSGYIGYDIAKSQAYPKTVDNAVDCALDIYIDIINLFIRLLSILNRRS
ncbi:MAG: US12 family protein [Bacteroidales bacterium]|nr:US12 family protein [Bacteroidales bacterium]